MKTIKPITKISLVYCPNSDKAMLFTPGTHELEGFLNKYGHRIMTVGSCHSRYPKDRKGVGCFWMIHFHHAVVRDGVDPIALHKTLAQIPEYRHLCAGDIPYLSKYANEDWRDYGILSMD